MRVNWRLNDLYIISYERPECQTAQLITRMGWPDKHWHIMCEDDDPTLDEYRKKWGKHVLTFRIQDYLYTTDYLDNAGTTLAHGAAPVRNAVIKYSHDHGELRHWQMDDDYDAIKRTVFKDGQPVTESCQTFAQVMQYMSQIADIGYSARIPVTGSTVANKMYPDEYDHWSVKVFSLFNIDSNGLDPKWRGRLSDDTINCLDVLNSTRPTELIFKCLSVNTAPTQTNKGGLTEFYKQTGSIRKIAYALMINPIAVQPNTQFGRIHCTVFSERNAPKWINPDDVKQ